MSHIFILGVFRHSKFKIFFNHGENFIKKNDTYLNLGVFRHSKFKIFFNHGEDFIRKRAHIFILGVFKPSKYKIFFNHGEDFIKKSGTYLHLSVFSDPQFASLCPGPRSLARMFLSSGSDCNMQIHPCLIE